MKIPLIDLAAQYRAIQPEIDTAIRQVLESGQFILGPTVAALEQEMAAYVGTKHAIGVASGTDALVLGLRALGVGAGDEVIVPTYTFFASAEAVMLVGATPVFVDIEAETYCIDVQQVAARITPRTKAIMPVHLYGHPVDMAPLQELARTHNLKLIEDNAQALGATYAGHKTGSLGDVGCISFFPSKNLGGFGDGGMVVTNDDEVAQKVRMLRTHGWRKKYYPEMLGYNSRLDTLQAAILRVKLRYLDKWNERRREFAQLYTDQLAHLNIGLPCERPHARHVYHLYIIQVNEREYIQQYLQERGVASAVYYPQPLHQTAPCQHLMAQPQQFPIAEQASRETLALPLYPEMSEEQVQYVVAVVQHALTGIEVGA